MEQHLLLLLLFTGVHSFVLPFPRTYVLIQELKTWSDAQAYCRDRYTDLAIINTTEEITKLQMAAQTKMFSSSAWIGLHTNVNSWHWTINNETLGSFRPWDTRETNNKYRNELCGYIIYNQWHDGLCIWRYPFVCFDDRLTGNDSYIFINITKTWNEAQLYCRQYYTDLATARDEIENSVVGSKNYLNWTWFGLRRDPWKWTDQTTDVSIITWSLGNPNDYLMNKSCVYMNGGLAGAEPCSTTLPFYCFSYPKKQQIIRMKFKSSEDVNDPAITASIEEKLKQKLEEHGMTKNITVTWRKQPDWEVFHKEENITKDITYAGQNCNL